MKRLIEKYNKPGNVIFVSSYPEKNVKYSKKVCAVGGFTKNTLESLKNCFQKNNIKGIVITTLIKRQKGIYEEGGNLIYRIFKRDNPQSYIDLLSSLLKFNQIKTIFIEFEFASYGNTLTTGLFIIVPIILQLLNKNVYLVMHQVVNNLNEIYGHLGWQKNNWQSKIFSYALKYYYKIVSFFCDKIIVLEEEFKQRLIKIGVNKEKIQVIPHGVDINFKIYSKKIARKKLSLPQDKFIILYFGYLTWYKGADIFLKLAKKTTEKNILFIIAGGPSFTQKNKPHYQKFLCLFKKLPKNLIVTGFVPEKKISLYFSACDLVMLPYRSMLSSSGPLSLAFSFEKPVMLSEKLQFYLKTKDFRNAVKKAQLRKKDLFFSLIKSPLKKLTPRSIKKLALFSRLMKKQRNFSTLATQYFSLINDPSKIRIKINDYNLETSLIIK